MQKVMLILGAVALIVLFVPWPLSLAAGVAAGLVIGLLD